MLSKSLYLLVAILLLSYSSFAAVTSVDYQLRYDESSCNFDVFLIINAGSAVNHFERIQSASQITIIVPTGTIPTIASNHAPLQGNNPSGSGSVACVWYQSNNLNSPEVTPAFDYYTFKPTLSPTARYNNLYTGDSVKLFSIQMSDVVAGVSGIRIFENGVDPGPNAPGMGGGNFSNGFTMGSATQRYRGNVDQVHPISYPEIQGQHTVYPGTQVQLTPSTGGSWTNENSSVATLYGTTVTATNEGIGKFRFTPNSGCSQSVRLVVKAPSTATPINTGLGTMDPDPTSILDISSTTRGIRCPQVEMDDLPNVASPQEGMIVYVPQGSKPGFYYWQDEQWHLFNSSTENGIQENGEGSSSFVSRTAKTELSARVQKLEEMVRHNQVLLQKLKEKSSH